MNIISPEFEAKFKEYPLKSRKTSKSPVVISKLYEVGEGDFIIYLLTEYDPQTQEGFGCRIVGNSKINVLSDWGKATKIQDCEHISENWMKIDVEELDKEKRPFYKEDLSFQPKPFSEALKEAREAEYPEHYRIRLGRGVEQFGTAVPPKEDVEKILSYHGVF